VRVRVRVLLLLCCCDNVNADDKRGAGGCRGRGRVRCPARVSYPDWRTVSSCEPICAAYQASKAVLSIAYVRVYVCVSVSSRACKWRCTCASSSVGGSGRRQRGRVTAAARLYLAAHAAPQRRVDPLLKSVRCLTASYFDSR